MKQGNIINTVEGSNSTLHIIFLIVLTLPFSTAFSQEKSISLQEAIDIALKQNLSLQASRLHTIASQQLERSAFDIPFTSVAGEYGQLNSIRNDTRFTISQAIAFPAVYKRQRDLFAAQTESNRLNEKVLQLTVKKQVTHLYYDMIYLLEKRKILLRADSIYAEFLQKQEQRFKVGETNIVEKTSAETQRTQVLNQLQQLNGDFAIIQTQLSYYLNTNTPFIPQYLILKIEATYLPDTGVIENFPVILLKRKQQDIALQEIGVNKARKFPLLNGGYTNQSIAGFQNVNGTEKYYGPAKRFSSVMAGVSIPLFNTAATARITSAKTRLEAIKVEYADTVAFQKSTVQQLLLRHQKNEQTIRYFETAALKQAAILTQNATLQFVNGDINFLEWALIVNQSISIQSEYIEAIREWNRTIIELNSYSPDF